ncbi:MAG: zinc-binding dehydrogenase [Chloroflexi bacterium]|nr:zinc-binding dehydrogenase [Chloroflexota bacterium]
MRALIVAPDAPGRLRIAEVPDPTPKPGECLIHVEAVSLNRGEVNQIARVAAGTVLGWDAAGTVIQAAAQDGPAVGTRVVTNGPARGWAELRAVDVRDLAELPADVDIGAAAALPVAGVTALRALRVAGSLLGRRVLVTGASGGVGRFAVQLAHRAGAYVIAVVGSEARGAGLTTLGADEIVTSIDVVTRPVFAVIETVGGQMLATAFGLLEAGGSVISIGAASGQATTFSPYSTVGPHRSLVSFTMRGEDGSIGQDLAYLAGLVQSGALDPQIAWRGSWERSAEAVQLLLGRKINGKAILDITR